MQKIKLNDGTELQVKTIFSKEEAVQGTTRKVLGFYFYRAEYEFNELEALFADKNNTDKIIIYEADKTTTYLHEGFNIRCSMVLKPEIINEGDINNPPVYEDVIIVTMAQETYLERQLSLIMNTNKH